MGLRASPICPQNQGLTVRLPPKLVFALKNLPSTLSDGRRAPWGARALTHKMHTLWMGGRLADACAAGEEAVAIANTVSDSSLSVSAWLYLGQVHYSLADYPRAAGLFQDTIAVLAGNRDTDRLGLHSYPSVLARIFLADCSSITGEFDDAEKRAQEAVELANVVDDEYSRAAAHCRLGSVHLRKGEIEAAIPALECAASLCRTYVVNSWMKGTLSSLCLAYALVGRITDAQPVLEEATRWVQTPGRADYIADVCLVNLLAGCLHAASKLVELGLDRARTHGERANLARCLNVFAEIELTRDSPDFDKAGDSYRQALAQATELGMRPLIAHCHAGLAKLYYRTAKRADSKEHLAAAATMYRGMGMTYWLQRAEMEIAGCC
jgi:tetratricopeptide (TPR) repeat protein